MAFTPYVTIAALMVAGVAAALRNWPAAAVAGVVTVGLAAAVLPRAVGDGTVDATGRETLSVLSANIHHGTADPKAVVALVDRFHPDLLSIQELTPSFAAKLRREGIADRLPATVLSIHRGASGAGLYSRLPMRRLPDPTHYEFRLPRAALAMPGGRTLRVVGVHPYPPQQTKVDVWSGALDSLPATGSSAPWVLAGDFNATLDHAELRDILDRGYRDAADVAGKGLEPTWPQEWRLPPVTIDHILADKRIAVVDYGVEGLPGSDHRAIHAVLALP